MDSFLRNLFNSTGFPARWNCGNWSEGHGWLHIISDLAVFGAYMAIPIVLAFFITRRRDIPFPRLFWMFVAFIGFCGLTHLVEAIIFWEPIYRVSGVLKFATAIASWATVGTLIRIMPVAVSLRSPAELEREVALRTAEVQARTIELAQLNESLKQANAQLEEFSAIVSHDLKAPLRAIDSFTKELAESLEGRLNEEEQQFLFFVTGGVERMKTLIRDLLAYAHADSARGELASVDLNSVVSRIVAELGAGHPETPPEIEVDDLPTVLGESTKLQQVFQNLLGNAVKFSGDGPAKIAVRVKSTDDGWRFSISDQGIGIEARFAERIFKPFSRLHHQSEYEGSGIGLSIVKKIVRQLGGEITVTSTLGSGSTFSFTVPKQPPEPVPSP